MNMSNNNKNIFLIPKRGQQKQRREPTESRKGGWDHKKCNQPQFSSPPTRTDYKV